MKYILEYGHKGGFHVDNQKMDAHGKAAVAAANLVCLFLNDPHASNANEWRLGISQGRKTWETETHFAALTKLDGKLRGSASSALWRKSPNVRFPGQVISEA